MGRMTIGFTPDSDLPYIEVDGIRTIHQDGPDLRNVLNAVFEHYGAEGVAKVTGAALRDRVTVGDLAALRAALAPLVAIADAYDANELDDEARKFWGSNLEQVNTTPTEQIELYTGRGGNRLLTLADCLKARELAR